MALVTFPRQLAVNASGIPRVGAKLYVYDATTTTPHAAYTTSAYATPHSLPIESLSAGLFPAIYVKPDDGPYKLVITDSADVTLWTEDDIPAPLSESTDILSLIFDSATTQAITPDLSRTAAEIAAGVTPVDYTVPSHVHDGVLRVLRYVANTIPGTTNLDSGMAAAKLVLAQMANASAVIELPPGKCLFSSGITFAPTPFSQQVKLRGHGSGVTRMMYDGAGDAISFTSTTILQEVSGLTVDCTDADPAANGINLKCWRSYIDDIYLVAPTDPSTGSGLLLDNVDGTFDVKVSRFYINDFAVGVNCIGTNLTTEALTNFNMWGGYVGANGVNFKFENCLDVCIIGAQAESPRTALGSGNNIELENVRQFIWLGGAIEGAPNDGIEITGTGSSNIFVRAGMFNNLGGDITGSDFTADINGRLYGAVLTSESESQYGFFIGGIQNFMHAGAGSPEGVTDGYRGDIRMAQDTVAPYVRAFGTSGVLGNTGWLPLGLAPTSVTAANLGSAAHAINANGFKFDGRQVWDTTNRKLYIARGANATDPWDLCDGSASVTPS